MILLFYIKAFVPKCLTGFVSHCYTEDGNPVNAHVVSGWQEIRIGASNCYTLTT